MRYDVYKVYIKPLYSASPNKYFYWYNSSSSEMQIGLKMVKVCGINLITFENMLLRILNTCVAYLASETSCHKTKQNNKQKKPQKLQSDFSCPLPQMPAVL